MTKQQRIGALGERLAYQFLRKNGYNILETNYRCPAGEIDIIALKEQNLVFIEVRTRTGNAFGSPEESITPVKAARLRELAAYYGQCHEGLAPDWRIDVVAISLEKSGRVSRIELIENAIGGV